MVSLKQLKLFVPEEYNSWVKVTKEIFRKAFENLCVYVGYEEREFPKMKAILDFLKLKEN